MLYNKLGRSPKLPQLDLTLSMTLLSQVMLPDSVLQIRDQLAKNIHEVWAKNKIEAGYTYGEVSTCNCFSESNRRLPQDGKMIGVNVFEQHLHYCYHLERCS